MLKALLYVRVSSKDQEDGYSLDAQEKLGLDYAKRNNLDIIQIWRVSESAWKLDRKSFNEMIVFSKKHQIKNIIFDVTDRMTRNLYDLLKIDELVKQHDVIIHFSRNNKTYHKDSKSDDEFILGMESLIARKYSNDISTKAKMGMQEKIEQGGFNGDAPIGYLNNVAERTLYVDPVRSPYVKRMFELYASGKYSIGMITDMMKNEGLKSRRTNALFHKSRIHKMLMNPIYHGKIRFKGRIYQGKHEPLISQELFDKVQTMLNRKVYTSVRNNYPFNNVLLCNCGCRIVGALYKKRQYLYYHCTQKKGKHQDAPFFTEPRLLNMFRETIDSVSITPEEYQRFKVGLKMELDDSLGYRENLIQGLSVEKKRLTDRLTRLYEDKLDKKVTESFWKERKTEYENRLQEIETTIHANTVKTPYNYEAGLKKIKLAERLSFSFESGNSHQKVKLLQELSLNHVYKSEKLEPQMKKPFSYLAEGPLRPYWRG